MDLPEKHPLGTGADGQEDVRAFLEHLTGPSRGMVQWLSRNSVDAVLSPDNVLHFAPPGAGTDWGQRIATLTWSAGSYEISAADDQEIWLNRRKITTGRLSHLDMIEFGETGPMSRYRICDRAFPSRWPVDDILSDAFAYARSSRRPFGPRLSNAVCQSGRRLAGQTTVFFRVTVILSLLALAVLGYVLYDNDRRFEETLQQEARRIAAVAAALSQTQDEALTPDDLGALRTELESRLMTNVERLDSLERRSEAAARVIRDSSHSVAFLQGAFGLRHAESGAFLRHVVDDAGNRLSTPFGQPWIDPTGTGDIAEFQVTGTGFLLGEAGLLVTNRHVAMPWTSRGQEDAFREAGLEPEMLSIIAYLPGLSGDRSLTLERVSETEDLAILRMAQPPEDRAPLALAETPPRAGDEVVLMGYPTGLRALLVQAGPEFLEQLETLGEAQFWQAAARLSERDLIWPLSSRGIVAHVGENTILYDAETTMGGSGGPVLNANGQVMAINTAILPEFGGSNMGVPVSRLRELMELRETQ